MVPSAFHARAVRRTGETVLLNASVGVQRVLARLRPVQSHRSTVAETIRRQGLLLAVVIRRFGAVLVRLPAATRVRS